MLGVIATAVGDTLLAGGELEFFLITHIRWCGMVSVVYANHLITVKSDIPLTLAGRYKIGTNLLSSHFRE